LKKEEMAAAESAAAATTIPHLEGTEEMSAQLRIEAAPLTQEVSSASSTSSADMPVQEDSESNLSKEEKKKLVEAIKTLSSDSALVDVKETLAELKEDRQDFIEVRSFHFNDSRMWKNSSNLLKKIRQSLAKD
jgi:hypothetical protein